MYDFLTHLVEDNFIEEEDEDVTNSWAVTTTTTASSYKHRVGGCLCQLAIYLYNNIF